MNQSELSWTCSQFEELSTDQLYRILQLRAEVFVVEQNCVYQDVDGYDHQAFHISGQLENQLVCYSRLLPPGAKYTNASIGRVVTKNNIRGGGLGKVLMQKSISHCQQKWPVHGITISAQQYLESFYAALGFSTESEPYMEDNIPHIEMQLAAT